MRLAAGHTRDYQCVTPCSLIIGIKWHSHSATIDPRNPALRRQSPSRMSQCRLVSHSLRYQRIARQHEKYRSAVKPLLRQRIPELMMMVMKCTAEPWRLGPLVPVRSLRSKGTHRLLVPQVKRSTVGSRAFEVAGPKALERPAGRCNIQ